MQHKYIFISMSYASYFWHAWLEKLLQHPVWLSLACPARSVKGIGRVDGGGRWLCLIIKCGRPAVCKISITQRLWRICRALSATSHPHSYYAPSSLSLSPSFPPSRSGLSCWRAHTHFVIKLMTRHYGNIVVIMWAACSVLRGATTFGLTVLPGYSLGTWYWYGRGYILKHR